METTPILNSFSISFVSLIFFFVTIKLIWKSKTKTPILNLPPGPPKLPIIGNLHNLVGSLTHQSLRDMAKIYGPIMHLQIGEVSVVVVSTSDVAKSVTQAHDVTLANRPDFFAPRVITYDFGDLIFAPYGNYWQKVRKVCVTELLNSARVKSFQSIREEEVASLVKNIYLSEGSPINLSKQIFSLVYSIVSRAIFGEKCKDQDAFIANVLQITRLIGGFQLCDLYPSIKVLPTITGLKYRAEKIHRETDRILNNIIDEHRKRKVIGGNENEEAKENLVDVLLKLQEHDNLDFPLTDDNIKGIIMDMFAAGSDTSSTTIEWAMAELIKNPTVMHKAQAEVRRAFAGKPTADENGIQKLKFLRAVFKETMRLHPPLPLLIPRECRESINFHGYDIPAKTKLIINAWALGRDPEHWIDAERFWPERFLESSVDFKGSNFEFIPFGSGRRVCPGISFALPNVELPLAQLLFHFDWELGGGDGVNGEDLDMGESVGLAVKKKHDLVLIPTPSHHPSNITCV